MIYIIVVNYNSYKLTEKCIKSIFKSSYSKFKVILIDNKSTDNSIELINNFIKESHFHIKLILNDYNGGFASGANVGIKYALSTNDCKYLFILNNDTLIKSDCVKQLISNYSINTIVGPLIYNYDNSNHIQAMGGIVNKCSLSTQHLKEINIDKISYLPGTALFFNKEIIDIVGFFPEEYFMYYEDVDWSTAAKLNGISLIINESAVIFHKKKLQLPLYLKTRSIYNRILYCNKYFKHKLPVIIALSLVSFLKLIFIYLIRKHE